MRLSKEEAQLNENTKELEKVREVAGIKREGPQEVEGVEKAEEIKPEAKPKVK